MKDIYIIILLLAIPILCIVMLIIWYFKRWNDDWNISIEWE